MANAPRAEDSVEERLRLIEKAASSAWRAAKYCCWGEPQK